MFKPDLKTSLLYPSLPILYPSLHSRAQRVQMWLRAIRHITRREVRRSLASWPLLSAAFVALVVVIGLHFCAVRFTSESGMYVDSRLFVLPMEVVTTVGYLLVMFGTALSSLSLDRQGAERTDWDTVDDIPTLLIARSWAYVIVYGLLLLVLIPAVLLVTWVSNLLIPPLLFLSLLPSLVSAALVVSIGLFIAVAAPTREAALATVVAVIVITWLLQSIHLILASLPSPNPYQVLLPILRSGQQLLQYLSPFATSDAMLKAALRSDFPELLRFLLVSLLNIAGWLTAACMILKRKD